VARRRRSGRTGRIAARTFSIVVLVVLGVIAGGLLARCTGRSTQTTRHRAQPAVATETPVEVSTPESVLVPATPEPPTPSARPAPAQSGLPSAAPSAATPGTPVPLPPPPAHAQASGNAKLAIIIDDCGQWRDTELALIALPIPLTMSILPRTPYSGEIAKAATDAGKGVMLHLPMQPVSHLDPGPGKITTDMSDAQIAATVRDDLAHVPLARGVNNHEGSKATADERVMRDVAAVLADENRFFIDSKTSGDSVAEKAARDAGIATAGRDVFLDNRAEVAATEASLREAAAVAKADGSAIAIGHPKSTTLAAIRNLYPTLQADGITFVLAEDLVHAAPAAAATEPSDGATP
jgi:polysaccharide deacetylase 2 family uncharacterized protein YibQ